MVLTTPAHCGDLPPSYAGPATLEERLDHTESNIRKIIETHSGFADMEVQRRKLIACFKFFDADGIGSVDYDGFVAALVRMNFIGVQKETVALFERSVSA